MKKWVKSINSLFNFSIYKGEGFMRLAYLLLGIFLSFNLTLTLIEPYQRDRDVTTTKIQSLQSCYFSAVKFAGQDPDKSAEFCDKHSREATEHYSDIADQMDQITDQKYSPVQYYWKKIKTSVSVNY